MEDDFGLWELAVSMFWFMLLACWIWLLMAMIGDVLRDTTVRGAAKAAWVVLIVFLPWIGAISYLAVRGDRMNERVRRAAAEINEARHEADAAPGANVSGQLAGLEDLHERGVISTDEYHKARAKVLA